MRAGGGRAEAAPACSGCDPLKESSLPSRVGHVPNFNPVYVSGSFLDHLKYCFPAAFQKGNAAYRRLLQELLFASWVDPLSGEVVLSRKHLARIEGKEHLLKQHRYSGGQFLQNFQQDTGLDLQITEAQWLKGRARTARPKWPLGLENLLSSELQVLPSERAEHLQLVDFEGRPMSKTALAELRRELRKERQQREGPADVRLLNSVSPQTYNQFTRYFDEALESAASIGAVGTEAIASDAYGIQADGRRHSNLRTLYVLFQRGLAPTYQAVHNSPRYYTLGVSLSQLSPKVRRALLGGAWQLDLAAAQLAILARLWNLPGWQSILESAVHGQQASQIEVWAPLLRAVGLEGLEHKRAFKTLVYSAAYGMSQRNLLKKATGAFGAERATALFETSLMQELLAGRAQRTARLKEEGGIVDPVSGEFVALVDWEKRLGVDPQSGAAIRSLLAYEAQAIELDLMRPVLDRMRTDSRFRVVLWLHDGCYVTTGYDKEMERKQIERVVREVNARAARAGIATVLTCEKLI